MIEPNELRIGNKIKRKSNGNICTVNWGIIKDFELSDASSKDYEAIPLSVEFLLTFGFEAFPWGWVKKSKKDFGVRLNIQTFSYDVSGNYPVQLQFVHELQNLYLDLTKEKL